jgi:hypothetical protein
MRDPTPPSKNERKAVLDRARRKRHRERAKAGLRCYIVEADENDLSAALIRRSIAGSRTNRNFDRRHRPGRPGSKAPPKTRGDNQMQWAAAARARRKRHRERKLLESSISVPFVPECFGIRPAPRSAKGGALVYGAIGQVFRRLSRRLGFRITPHDARDAAATTWAIFAPGQISVARDLLAHSDLRTTIKHYNRAKGIEASAASTALMASPLAWAR